jgi:hypothetical protein
MSNTPIEKMTLRVYMSSCVSHPRMTSTLIKRSPVHGCTGVEYESSPRDQDHSKDEWRMHVGLHVHTLRIDGRCPATPKNEAFENCKETPIIRAWGAGLDVLTSN